MDKPMTFIEWCASKGVIPYSLGIEAAYEAGQQSQQAKVEELQKRVDAAAKLIGDYRAVNTHELLAWSCHVFADSLERALKGEG
ncbi:hypothetical protein OIN82_14330 [Acinetobacter baumannii]|nr:hypothetical protein [Acinetobacter baumannii]